MGQCGEDLSVVLALPMGQRAHRTGTGVVGQPTG